jgi:phosphoglucosamine mutase
LLPQTLINVKVARRFNPLEVPAVCSALAKVEQQLAGRGRAVLRASGTEPLIRVMIEADDGDEAKTLANQLADAVRAAAP